MGGLGEPEITGVRDGDMRIRALNGKNKAVVRTERGTDLIVAVEDVTKALREQMAWLECYAKELELRHYGDKEESRPEAGQAEEIAQIEAQLARLLMAQERRLRAEIDTVRREAVEHHNQQEAYHSLLANAIERVRYMLMNQQIEGLSTKGLKKELRKRQALKKNRGASG